MVIRRVCEVRVRVSGVRVRVSGVRVRVSGVRVSGVRVRVRVRGMRRVHFLQIQDSRKKRLNPSLSTMIPRKGDATAESQYTRLWRNEGGGERGERGREEGGRRE